MQIRAGLTFGLLSFSRARRAIDWLWVLLPLLMNGAPALGQEIVTLSTRPGVTQNFFIATPPKNPHAIAILFPGSGGFIRQRQLSRAEQGRVYQTRRCCRCH